MDGNMTVETSRHTSIHDTKHTYTVTHTHTHTHTIKENTFAEKNN